MSESEFNFENVSRPWRKVSILKELYEEKMMTTAEMGDILGCSRSCVENNLHQHGIEIRDRSRAVSLGYGKDGTATNFHTDDKGYEIWKVDGHPVQVSRLLAVAEYGYEAVCDNDIHHENEIPWDNRPENIRPIDAVEHMSYHAKKMDLNSIGLRAQGYDV